MREISVRHEGGSRYTLVVRGHEVVVDQPVEDGGTDAGPTPAELFVASLAGCIAYFAGGFLERHDIDAEGFGVEASYEYSDDAPHRVASIDVRIALPPAFPESRLTALQRVVEQCTVHNSLKQAPEVRIQVATGTGPA